MLALPMLPLLCIVCCCSKSLFSDVPTTLSPLPLTLSSSPCICHCIEGMGWGRKGGGVLGLLQYCRLRSRHACLASTEPVHFSGPHRTQLSEHLSLVASGKPLRRQLILSGVVPDVVSGARRRILSLELALLFPSPHPVQGHALRHLEHLLVGRLAQRTPVVVRLRFLVRQTLLHHGAQHAVQVRLEQLAQRVALLGVHVPHRRDAPGGRHNRVHAVQLVAHLRLRRHRRCCRRRRFPLYALAAFLPLRGCTAPQRSPHFAQPLLQQAAGVRTLRRGLRHVRPQALHSVRQRLDALPALLQHRWKLGETCLQSRDEILRVGSVEVCVFFHLRRRLR
eukprot:Rhum_TRINITY_DN11899_c0_g1::Rhum_TRINITY_DN11899_c0_g1_i1::g.47710::m.47710